MKREIQCKKCGVTFFSGTRGAIPDFCPSCKYQGYKDRHYHYQRKDPGLFPSGRIIKKLCLEQDKYQCALCGNTDNPSIHHKDGKSYYRFKLNTNNSLDNLITLCHKCHMKTHGFIKSPRTLEIIEYHVSNPHFTRSELAKHFNLSRERIGQIIGRKSQQG